MMRDLVDFVTESNAIERIHRPPTPEEIRVHEELMERDEVTVADLVDLVIVCTQGEGRLREHSGMDVIIHGARTKPPLGGPGLVEVLRGLLAAVNQGSTSPWRGHVEFELLHPFDDGNGRSGRALWAWHRFREDRDPFVLPFLQSFYYETLRTMETG